VALPAAVCEGEAVAQADTVGVSVPLPLARSRLGVGGAPEGEPLPVAEPEAPAGSDADAEGLPDTVPLPMPPPPPLGEGVRVPLPLPLPHAEGEGAPGEGDALPPVPVAHVVGSTRCRGATQAHCDGSTLLLIRPDVNAIYEPATHTHNAVEVLLPDCKHDDRHPTFSATDARPGGHDSTTRPNSQDPEPRTQKQRQCYLQEQRHAQHHHHLKEEHFKKQRTPKKGRDIGNDIICKFCKLV
jgi:hypothetical protein